MKMVVIVNMVLWNWPQFTLCVSTPKERILNSMPSRDLHLEPEIGLWIQGSRPTLKMGFWNLGLFWMIPILVSAPLRALQAWLSQLETWIKVERTLWLGSIYTRVTGDLRRYCRDNVTHKLCSRLFQGHYLQITTFSMVVCVVLLMLFPYHAYSSQGFCWPIRFIPGKRKSFIFVTYKISPFDPD